MKNAMVNATKANILKVLNKNVHDCGYVFEGSLKSKKSYLLFLIFIL